MTKLLFNPFEKYNDKLLLVIGLMGTLAGSLLAYAFDTRFDNTMHVTYVPDTLLTEPLTDNIFNIACMFFALYIFGYFINKKVRPIDILNTAIIARLPFYLDSLCNINGFMYKIAKRTMEEGPQTLLENPSEMLLTVVISLLTLPLFIWYIALLYNGFKTATNLKTLAHKFMFAGALILSLILSNLLFYILY